MLLNRVFQDVGSDPKRLMREYPKISDMLARIEKLSTSAMKAEKYVGGLLSRKQAAAMVGDLIDVIAVEITDDEVLHRIADQFDQILNKKYEEE